MIRANPIDWRSAGRLEQASSWRLRIESDDSLATSEEFLVWLSEPLNRDAYGRVCATWDSLDDYLAAPQLLAIRRDALARARRSAVWGVLPDRRRAALAMAVLLIVMIAGIGAWHFWPWQADYSTGIGERRVVVLDDGSRVSLDSSTEIRVRYTKDARQLFLGRGRARFDVTHNINRPFSVTAGTETVIAVGTSFDVEKLGSKVLVTLIEGKVLVKAGSSQTSPHSAAAREASKTTTLLAGQQLIIAADERQVVQPTAIAIATAWESGRLIFNNEPLAEAVERINRYAEKPLLVDSAVANVRISGVFNAGDANAFVDAVTSYFPIQAGVNGNSRTILQKRS